MGAAPHAAPQACAVWLLLILAASSALGAAVPPEVCSSRYVVRYQEGRRQQELSRLSLQGFKVQTEGPGFFAVRKCGPAAAAAKEAQQPDLLKQVGAFGELDHPVLPMRPVPSARHRHSSSGGSGGSSSSSAGRQLQGATAAVEPIGWQAAKQPQDRFDPWDSNLPPCAYKDKVLGKGPGAEIEPYGVSLIQGNSTLLPNTTINSGVIICVIDSGLWAAHPDLSKGPNTDDGCKKLDDFDPSGCPFPWDEDKVGHGTNVNGAISAPRNGAGIVGVVPNGAEMYTVRIWDTNAAVAYGEGPYASDLVLAYTQCEGRLRSRQALNPAKRYRMVINLSLGAAGPLTVEGLWFEGAAKRGDMLFVGAAGNNGTDQQQWDLYPAAFPQVLSVASLDCNSEHSYFSQQNADVALSAPGNDVLTTTLQSRGKVRAWVGFTANDTRVGPITEPEPRPMAGAPLAAVANRTVAECSSSNCTSVSSGAICLASVGPMVGDTQRGAPRTDPQPCERYTQCLDAGGSALLLWRPDDAAYDDTFIDSFRLDCGVNCSCWQALQPRLNGTNGVNGTNGTDASSRPMPAVALSANQAMRMQAAAQQGLLVSVSTYDYDYEYVDGTSMAVPYVTGGAARIWAAFPRCNASEVSQALTGTAKDLGSPGRDIFYGHGLVQLEAAYKKLAARPCAKAPPPSPSRESTVAPSLTPSLFG